MKLIEADFLKMTYNPVVCGQHTFMWVKYPYFQKKPIFCQPKEGFDKQDLNDMLKFVVLFVDRQSPIYNETDSAERQKLAMKWGMIEKNGSRAYNLIVNEDEYYREVLYEYFKSINNYMFEMWYSQKIQYHNLCKAARMPFEQLIETSFNSLKALQTAMDDSLKMLAKTEEKLFNDLRIRDMVGEEQDKVYVEAYAEQYAIDLNF